MAVAVGVWSEVVKQPFSQLANLLASGVYYRSRSERYADDVPRCSHDADRDRHSRFAENAVHYCKSVLEGRSNILLTMPEGRVLTTFASLDLIRSC